ncbi:polynucleotide adenylyltransferase PcnB [Neisseria sp. Ec49-e6-T10]|uniref:polynucleotide adenylyltransferase PcnB n=1 Tax=Neisseria sp. Ec49-e6-T10 TaxID=3140744 RepID=UPI003EBA9237
MLKKWVQKVFGGKRSSQHKEATAQILKFAEHHISKDQLSFAAEKVIKRLQEKNFDAFVVGGAVRDLLLNREPKDFDIATNASPEQVRQLFRRSRIIGRRFKIVHVMIGPETIEVTTFRGGQIDTQNEHGRIMKDNSYGTQQEDAERRDFTCNALYYNPRNQTIIDYHHGVDDIKAKKLVMIGDATERYQEDPVRILRAIRLSSKLGFTLDKKTAQPIIKSAYLLKKEPPARLFDELIKLLLSGEARKCLEVLQGFGITSDTFPLLTTALTKQDTHPFVALTLRHTDERLQAGKPVSIGYLLASLLWPLVSQNWERHISEGQRSVPALILAMNDIQNGLDKNFSIPKRFSSTMREIWLLQPQFEARFGTRPYRLLSQQRFRAAYDFMLTRVEANELPQELAQWWTDFQVVSDSEKQEMIAQIKQLSGQSQFKKRRPKRKNNAKKNHQEH